MKVLFVDDSSTMRKVIELALKSGGYEYDQAESGEAALKKIESAKFDFFIVDVNMPVINGIELVKKIRSINDYLKVPIIILTTESEESLKEEGKKAGANDWIVKPFQKEDLLDRMKKLI
jgi:two-component system chemotaxis response regulator CheY